MNIIVGCMSDSMSRCCIRTMLESFNAPGGTRGALRPPCLQQERHDRPEPLPRHTRVFCQGFGTSARGSFGVKMPVIFKSYFSFFSHFSSGEE